MCRSNIKDDYFEYNELFKNFESKKIESVINSLRQPFADISKEPRYYNEYSMDCSYIFGVKNDIGFFCDAYFC